MNRGECLHHRHLGKLQGIVSIGLPLGVLPAPGFVVGAADNRLDPASSADIADPAARSAGFHHDQIRLDVTEGPNGLSSIESTCDRLVPMVSNRYLRVLVS